MTIAEQRINLARQILATQKTTESYYMPIQNNANGFIQYKDGSIKITAATNTQALHIEIYHPLTSAKSNPIIYVDDDGMCYRYHGEGVYFERYVKELLNQ